LLKAETPQAVFDNDHGAINDKPEIERAKAHQVARNAVLNHAGNGQKHGKRNNRSRDQCSADVPEQQKQNNNDEHGANEKIFLDRRNCPVNKFRPVIDRFCDDASRQRLRGFLKLRSDRLCDDAAVLANQHENRAEHDFLAVFCGGASAQFLAHKHVGDIGHAHWHAIAVSNDDGFQVVNAFRLPRGAN